MTSLRPDSETSLGARRQTSPTRNSMEIEVETPDGVPEHVQRTVSENAGVLKFDLHSFERE
jgi:hypothetical protein